MKMWKRWRKFFSWEPGQSAEFMKCTGGVHETVPASFIERSVMNLMAEEWSKYRRILYANSLKIYVKTPAGGQTSDPFNTISTIGWKLDNYRYHRWWRDPDGWGLTAVLGQAKEIPGAVAKAMPRSASKPPWRRA